VLTAVAGALFAAGMALNGVTTTGTIEGP